MFQAKLRSGETGTTCMHALLADDIPSGQPEAFRFRGHGGFNRQRGKMVPGHGEPGWDLSNLLPRTCGIGINQVQDKVVGVQEAATLIQGAFFGCCVQQLVFFFTVSCLVCMAGGLRCNQALMVLFVV